MEGHHEQDLFSLRGECAGGDKFKVSDLISGWGGSAKCLLEIVEVVSNLLFSEIQFVFKISVTKLKVG